MEHVYTCDSNTVQSNSAVFIIMDKTVNIVHSPTLIKKQDYNTIKFKLDCVYTCDYNKIQKSAVFKWQAVYHSQWLLHTHD